MPLPKLYIYITYIRPTIVDKALVEVRKQGFGGAAPNKLCEVLEADS